MPNSLARRRVVVVGARQKVGSGEVGYDRLILTAASLNKLQPIPGVADYAPRDQPPPDTAWSRVQSVD
jgi:NADH dehydrogenase FAD-containing subunit